MTDSSASARDVSRSVIVTGDGNAVSMAFGDSGASLPLRRQQVRLPERRRGLAPGERRELDVLDPARAAMPLVGRDAVLNEFEAWLGEETDLSVRALTGRAGSGKIRLAIELCRRIDPAQAVGDWAAGFLPASELQPVVDTLTTRDFDWERPTLLVIDFAGQAHAELARWLDRLAYQTIATKLRFLLLEREAPEGFGWWKELTGPGLNAAAARRDLFHDPGLRPVALPGLDALEDRRQVMNEALAAVSVLHGAGSAQEVPAAGTDAAFDARLAEAAFGNPLSLVMAGVLALEQGPRAALALRRLDAARRLAAREADRLRRLTGAGQERAMTHLVAFNGLAGGLPVAGL